MRETAQQLTPYFEAPAPGGPVPAIRCVAGTMRDYEALAAHHYLAGRPGTATRVLALHVEMRTAADRFNNRSASPRTVGVLVESMPALRGRMREIALGGRYSAWPARQRAKLIRDELRCISRVIVHPQ